MLKIQEAARLTGVTVRALHHYDAVGLLPPAAVTAAGYRLYGPAELRRLQEILFFRELEFPLAQIKAILEAPGYDRAVALQRHRQLLELKRRRLDRLLTLVDETIQGDSDMKFEAFDTTEYDAARTRYSQEAQARWGDTEAHRQSTQREAHRTEAEKAAMTEEMTVLLQELAALRQTDPAGSAAQALVARWQAHITLHHYDCSNQQLRCLGQLYTEDPRFTESLDRHGDGTAAFLAAAIAAYQN